MGVRGLVATMLALLIVLTLVALFLPLAADVKLYGALAAGLVAIALVVVLLG